MLRRVTLDLATRKRIKAMNNKELDQFITSVYNRGYADGGLDASGMPISEILDRVGQVHGIGPYMLSKVNEAIIDAVRSYHDNNKINPEPVGDNGSGWEPCGDQGESPEVHG